ncbi:glutathione S-transferase family protein [Azospirillum sp. TSH100]|uniref:glutathione S-transferase family protein n=1 Tax=Azospirillum sp. TSH100 TaxID=652764 RepID=UPI000D64B8C5|nr:glutathione S-transferase family protein [Azospirillum sp. TSH100]QCG90583.1 glutathione S-transferase family protein [Azospirillum sp. TSH100]
MPSLRLVSHKLCPYAQRAAITLVEKGVPYERQIVDLSKKPDWFKAMSPLGKVPLLIVDGDTVLFESAIICEYLEETQPGPRLHPEDPAERARHRAWVEFASATLNVIAGLYGTGDEAGYRAKIADLMAKMAWLEGALGGGPYFAGVRFSLVDAAFGPVFRYFETFETALPPLGIFDTTPKVRGWRQALAARASVRGAVTADYHELLSTFLRERGSYLSGLMLDRSGAG